MRRRTVRLLAFVAAVTAVSVLHAGDIVPANAKLEKLFERSAPIQGGLTEGPAVAFDGSIYFSDIAAGSDKGMILRFDPKTSKTTVFANDSGKSNGLLFDASGRLLACEGADGGGRRVARWDVRTKKRETLVDAFGGKRFNAPNDLAIDLEGRVYFTDPRYLGTETRELEHRAVYRVDASGSVVEVTHDVSKPNGIALSPDGKTLYVADHDNGTDRIDPTKPAPTQGVMRLLAFPLDENGTVSGKRRVLIDFGDEKGVDGMTTDVDGNLYLALRSYSRPGVLIVDPNGKELGHIPTGKSQIGTTSPVGLPSNCVFGRGVESGTLYVTVDTGLYRVRLNARGRHLPTRPQAELLKVFRNEFVGVGSDAAKQSREFVMGRDDGPASEAAAHRVRVAEPFDIAKYELPQNLWEAVMGQNPSLWKGPRNSVEMLSFDEAVTFCQVATDLSRALGLIDDSQVIRLPSEAEWEFAARAGTTTRYSFGDDVSKLDDHGWSKRNAAGNDPPVGAKKPNAWQLYDVHGYLWEWCADPWHASYDGAPTDGSAWKRNGDDSQRVLRGGSWKDLADKLTTTYRRGAKRALRDDAVGLRCVLARRR
jgi:gluconolactonase